MANEQQSNSELRDESMDIEHDYTENPSEQNPNENVQSIDDEQLEHNDSEIDDNSSNNDQQQSVIDFQYSAHYSTPNQSTEGIEVEYDSSITLNVTPNHLASSNLQPSTMESPPPSYMRAMLYPQPSIMGNPPQFGQLYSKSSEEYRKENFNLLQENELLKAKLRQLQQQQQPTPLLQWITTIRDYYSQNRRIRNCSKQKKE